jgi:hypothetical protein
MRRRFAEMASRAAAIQDLERASRLGANVAALAVWGGGPDGALAENVQSLAAAVTDLHVLLDPRGGGRVAQVLEVFAAWIAAVEEMWALRAAAAEAEEQEQEDGDGVGFGGEEEVVDGLGAHWRGEVAALERRVGGLVSLVEGLERPVEGSSAAEIVGLVTEVLSGTAEELALVARVERAVGEREREWVDRRLARLLGEESDELGVGASGEFVMDSRVAAV